jgi:hypothetical protein
MKSEDGVKDKSREQMMIYEPKNKNTTMEWRVTQGIYLRTHHQSNNHHHHIADIDT